MINDKSQQHTQEKKSDLSGAVLSRIKRENVCPRGKWYFMCLSCTMWTLWIITVIAGSIAVSETIYVSMHSGIEFFEMTHKSFGLFLLDSLPLIWLLAFVGLVVLAYFNMRRTPRGYRYPLWQIIVSSLVFTIGGGFVLHAAGVSHMVERMLDGVPGYLSAEARQEYLWIHPEDGRITGRYAESKSEEGLVRFIDSVDREWEVEILEMPSEERTLFYSGERVRLLGEADIRDGTYRFYGCRTMSWMPEGGHSMDTLMKTRKAVKIMLKEYEELPEEQKTGPELRCREIMNRVFHINY